MVVAVSPDLIPPGRELPLRREDDPFAAVCRTGRADDAQQRLHRMRVVSRRKRIGRSAVPLRRSLDQHAHPVLRVSLQHTAAGNAGRIIFLVENPDVHAARRGLVQAVADVAPPAIAEVVAMRPGLDDEAPRAGIVHGRNLRADDGFGLPLVSVQPQQRIQAARRVGGLECGPQFAILAHDIVTLQTVFVLVLTVLVLTIVCSRSDLSSPLPVYVRQRDSRIRARYSCGLVSYLSANSLEK